MATPQPASPPMATSSSSIFQLPLFLPIATLTALTAYNIDLFQPIFWPFFWGLAVSLPLHASKNIILNAILDAEEQQKDSGVAVPLLFSKASAEFIFGPLHPVFEEFLHRYHVILSSLFGPPASTPTQSKPMDGEEPPQVPVTAPIIPKRVDWSLWSLQWAVRVSMLSVLWDPVARKRWGMVVVTLVAGHAGWVVARAAGVGKGGKEVLGREVRREKWNGGVVSALIWAGVLGTLGSVGLFAGEVVTAVPTMTAQVANFLSIPPQPPITPLSSPFIPLIPNLGILTGLTKNLVPPLRSTVLSQLDAQLTPTNLTATQTATIVSAGVGVYEAFLSESTGVPPHHDQEFHAAVEAFRGRFLLITDAVRLAANGDVVGFWGRLDRLLERLGRMERREVKRWSARSTSALPGILGPKSSISSSQFVFFSTLGTFVASRDGLTGTPPPFLAKPRPLHFFEPLSTSMLLTSASSSSRVSLSHILNVLLLSDISLKFLPSPFNQPPPQTPLPLWPPHPLDRHHLHPASRRTSHSNSRTSLRALARLHLDGNLLRSGLFLGAHLWAAAVAEGEIILDGMGSDGIVALDGFAFWLGWVKMGTPLGIVVGPWAVMAFRRGVMDVRKKMVEMGVRV
ncbi:hypothetical protein BC829DRAFT_446167 [Chytridium lagenaria]|nr:hypothetical protein BC829DRAFT_446167 [Chytridium lagenaria]